MMDAKRIKVSIPCFIGDCNCAVFDNKITKMLPPYHEGCTCWGEDIEMNNYKFDLEINDGEYVASLRIKCNNLVRKRDIVTFDFALVDRRFVFMADDVMFELGGIITDIIVVDERVEIE